MTLAEVRKRMGSGAAAEAVRGPAGPQSGVTYSRADLVVYVLYDRDISKSDDAEVVLVRARARAGVADPVAFVRSIVPDLGEPALGQEHLSDGFTHGATVWEDESCDVEVSAYRGQAEWWQPGKGSVFLQIASVRFADAEASRSAASSAPLAVAGASSASQAKPPEELKMTLEASATPPGPAPVPAAADVPEPVLIPASYVPPRYPESARRMNFRGNVALWVRVKSDGTVGEIGVLEVSRTGAGFEQAAMDAVKQWRYQPATRGGKPEDATLTVRLAFE
jgi:TonB family protein